MEGLAGLGSRVVCGMTTAVTLPGRPPFHSPMAIVKAGTRSSKDQRITSLSAIGA